jgi:hypothetical protein
MTAANTGYNGWTNHSTWAVGLHLMDAVTEWIIDDKESWANDADNASDAGDLFRTWIDEMIEDSNINPLLIDLLDTDSINYQELGQHALDAALS